MNHNSKSRRIIVLGLTVEQEDFISLLIPCRYLHPAQVDNSQSCSPINTMAKMAPSSDGKVDYTREEMS